MTGARNHLSPAAKSLGARIGWRMELLARWIDGRLERMGPAAYIAAHWPWPLRKPYMRPALTLRPEGGGLGDELMCLAVFEEIKRLNPRCRITFVTRHPDFFRGQPQVDEVAAPAPGLRALTLSYGPVVPPPRPLMTLMAEHVGIVSRFPRIPRLKVNPSPSVRSRIESLPRPLAVVQPVASGWTTNKNWPLPYWEQCVRGLTAEGHVVEVGTEPALPADALGGRFSSLAGRTSLDDLAYVISQADLFIGPSSSGMHLASAFNVPALILFGGYESPAGYDFPNVHPLYSPVPCAPCWRQSCPYELKCLHAIAPEAVVEQALRMLTPLSNKPGNSP